jgi:lysophospholipase L1-like esterase
MIRPTLSFCVASWLALASPVASGAAADTNSTSTAPAASDPRAILSRSLVSAGNTARLQQVFARARRGGAVTIGVIGGSITQGARASAPEKRYGNLVADWWRRKFPSAQVKFVNAGIGATGSDYGALRAGRDLLSQQPDFVVVEYSVNDQGDPRGHVDALEGLVRQILTRTNQPAVMLLYTMDQKGENMQDWHAKVGRHYELPMASFRDALWPEIQAGRLRWTEIEADEVHPNDRGHAYLAAFVTNILESAANKGPRADAVVPALPAPLFTDQYEHVTFLAGDQLKPITNQGWTYNSEFHAFAADQPGSVIEFEITGRTVLVTDWHVRGPFGKARMQVDDQVPVIRDAWFDQTWGGYRDTAVLARDLAPGKHRVRIELLAEQNPKSEGHRFRLVALGAAGVGPQ